MCKRKTVCWACISILWVLVIAFFTTIFGWIYLQYHDQNTHAPVSEVKKASVCVKNWLRNYTDNTPTIAQFSHAKKHCHEIEDRKIEGLDY